VLRDKVTMGKDCLPVFGSQPSWTFLSLVAREIISHDGGHGPVLINFLDFTLMRVLWHKGFLDFFAADAEIISALIPRVDPDWLKQAAKKAIWVVQGYGWRRAIDLLEQHQQAYVYALRPRRRKPTLETWRLPWREENFSYFTISPNRFFYALFLWALIQRSNQAVEDGEGRIYNFDADARRLINTRLKIPRGFRGPAVEEAWRAGHLIKLNKGVFSLSRLPGFRSARPFNDFDRAQTWLEGQDGPQWGRDCRYDSWQHCADCKALINYLRRDLLCAEDRASVVAGMKILLEYDPPPFLREEMLTFIKKERVLGTCQVTEEDILGRDIEIEECRVSPGEFDIEVSG